MSFGGRTVEVESQAKDPFDQTLYGKVVEQRGPTWETLPSDIRWWYQLSTLYIVSEGHRDQYYVPVIKKVLKNRMAVEKNTSDKGRLGVIPFLRIYQRNIRGLV